MLMTNTGFVVAVAVYVALLLAVLIWQRVQINREEERHEAERRRWEESDRRKDARLEAKRRVLDRLGVRLDP